MKLTPEETREIQQVHRVFDEYLQRHLVEDLKTFLSLHTPWVATALLGFILVVALGIRLLMAHP